MDKEQRYQLFIKFDEATRIPMLVLALAMVPLLLGPALVQLPPSMEEAFVLLDLFIWAAFAFELAVKTYLAPSRMAYLRQNWVDVLIIALPLLRPLRVLRFLRLAAFLVRSMLTLRRILVHRGLGYSLTVGMAIIVLCAALVSIVEHDRESTIQSFPDALWWAMTTVSTVGYGDKYPVTPEGRVIAVFLMLAGITLFGILTATLAAYFVETGKNDDVNAQLREILDRLDRIEARQRGES